MTETDIDNNQIEQAELLLPWYVAGTASTEEIAQVEAWLKTDPAANAHLQRAREEHEVTLGASDELPMPRAAAVHDLMAAIGVDPNTHTKPSTMQRFWDFLSPRYAMAGVAALILLVAGQAITIGNLTGQPPATFETASGGAEVVDQITALVAFQPEITFETLSSELARLDIHIIDGPKPGGIYQLAANDSDQGREAFQTLSANKELVRFYSATP